MQKRIKAFTLIELLVVITIVGILAGFIFVSMRGAINSAKDAKVKADMSTLEKAIMEYATLNNNTYPAQLTNLVPSYVGSIPSNPNGGSYTYTNSTTRFTLSGNLSTGVPWTFDSNTSTWSNGYAYGQYKQKINIASTGNVAIAGPYPVKLTINTQALIPAKLDSGCTAIRFSDDPTTVNLNYWIESGCNTTNTIIWVNLPNGIAAGSNATNISMFYSPTTTTAGSNGDSTFPTPGMLFDDFNGALNTTSKWLLSNSPSYTISNSILTLNGNTSANIGSISGFQTNYAMRTKVQFVQAGSSNSFIGFSSVNNWATAPFVGFWGDNGYRCYAYVSDIAKDGSTIGTGNNTLEVFRNGTTSNIFNINDTQVYSETTQVPSGISYIDFRAFNAGTTMALDWVIVRPYNLAELIISSSNYVGGETTGQ